MLILGELTERRIVLPCDCAKIRAITLCYYDSKYKQSLNDAFNARTTNGIPLGIAKGANLIISYPYFQLGKSYFV